jgi:hypothetical protein
MTACVSAVRVRLSAPRLPFSVDIFLLGFVYNSVGESETSTIGKPTNPSYRANILFSRVIGKNFFAAIWLYLIAAIWLCL